MTLVYLGMYTFFLAIVWGFFIVAKIHSYKFKNFSDHIERITVILTVFLAVLSISGYIVLLFGTSGSDNLEINTDTVDYSEFDNINY